MVRPTSPKELERPAPAKKPAGPIVARCFDARRARCIADSLHALHLRRLSKAEPWAKPE